MKLSSQDIADFFKLFVFGIGSRIFGFLTVFLLARQLPIDHFAWWQLCKTAANYVLIAMEAGFFFHITLLIQKEGFSVQSVRTQIYRHRLKLGLMALPFYFTYLAFTDVPLWYAALLIPLFCLSIADYDSLAIGTGKSVITGYARLLKNGLTLCIVAIGALYSFASLPIAAATVGTASAAIYLHRSVEHGGTFHHGKIYTSSIWNSLRESKHFFTMQFTQTLMQSADLIIAGLFISNNDVAHYSIALLIAEFALFPTYMIQRVIQTKYIKKPNAFFVAKISLAGAATILAFFALHYFFLQFVYGLLFPKFDPAVLHGLVNILLIYVAIRIPNTFIQLHLNSTNLGHIVSTATILGTATNVVFNLLLIPKLGINVIPWVTVLAESVILLCLVYSIKRGRREFSRS